MSTKAKKIIYIVTLVIATAMIAGGGIAKIAGLATAGLSKAGVGNYAEILGIVDILFMALFIYPKTFKLGFIFLNCYFGGAIAAQLSHHNEFLSPAIPLIFVWIAAFLKEPTVFLPLKTTPK